MKKLVKRNFLPLFAGCCQNDTVKTTGKLPHFAIMAYVNQIAYRADCGKRSAPVEKPVDNVENSLIQPGFFLMPGGFAPAGGCISCCITAEFSLFWRNYVSVKTTVQKLHFFTKTGKFCSGKAVGGGCRKNKAKIFVRFPQSPFLYEIFPAGNTEHIFIVT